MQKAVAIGEASTQSGIKVPTIRYYEQIGLMPEVERSEGNRRYYEPAEVDRLRFIRHARELGFDIEAIKRLLVLQDKPDQSCIEADALARSHLIEVEKRIASLTALKAELERMVKGCSHGHVENCRVIEILADHGKCQFHADHQSTN